MITIFHAKTELVSNLDLSQQDSLLANQKLAIFLHSNPQKNRSNIFNIAPSRAVHKSCLRHADLPSLNFIVWISETRYKH